MTGSHLNSHDNKWHLEFFDLEELMCYIKRVYRLCPEPNEVKITPRGVVEIEGRGQYDVSTFIRARVFNQIYIENISLEQLKEVETKMRPHGISEAGFLGDFEGLHEVISNDAGMLSNFGITYTDIAKELIKFQFAIHDAYEGRQISLLDSHNLGIERDGFRVKLITYFGHQECPFQYILGDLAIQEPSVRCRQASDHYIIRRESTGREIEFSGLIPHLIRDHHFFEGKGTPYRLDPLKAIVFFGLKARFEDDYVEKMFIRSLETELGHQNPEIVRRAKHILSTWYLCRDLSPI